MAISGSFNVGCCREPLHLGSFSALHTLPLSPILAEAQIPLQKLLNHHITPEASTPKGSSNQDISTKGKEALVS